MQQNSTDVRSAAYAGHAADVDLNDAHGRLLYNLLVKEGLYTDNKYKMIKLATMHYKSWRQ
eukprot:3124961-Karenia_brevis.AAC.1